MDTVHDQATPKNDLHNLLDDLDIVDTGSLRQYAGELGRRAGENGIPLTSVLQQIEARLEAPLSSIAADTIGRITKSYYEVCHSPSFDGVEHLTSDVLRRIALAQISSAAEGNIQFDSMLSSIMGTIADAVNCDGCSLFLYDPYQQTLMLRATVGLNEDAVHRVVIRADAGVTGLAATTRQTQVAPNAREHPAFLPYPSTGEDQYTSQASVPITLENPDRLIGVLNLQTRQRHDFTPEQIHFIERAAVDLGVAIESARLFRRTDAALTRRINEMSMLQTATREMASTLQPDEILPLIARHAAELVRGTSAVIYRRRIADDGTPSVEPVARYPADSTRPEQDTAHAEFAESICHSRSARATSANSAEQIIDYGVPLMTSHAVHGAIIVRTTYHRRPSDEPLSLLQAFADSAALALENAELYDETRRGYATASTLLQEMHHRVRNNLQLVAALLSMQASRNREQPWYRPLREAVMRVQSIASIHDLLSGSDVTSTTVSSVVQTITDEASVNLVSPDQSIRFDVVPDSLEVTSRQATILALIVNECVTNAIVHGMHGRQSGTITVHAREQEGLIEILVEDDGNGPPDAALPETNGGLGTRIARTLAESDLGGSFSFEPREPAGSRAIIRFPRNR